MKLRSPFKITKKIIEIKMISITMILGVVWQIKITEGLMAIINIKTNITKMT